MSKSLKLILWLAAIFSVIIVAVVIGVSLTMSGHTNGMLDKEKWLQLTIEGNIAEAPGNESIFDDPSNFPPLTTEVTRLIYDASNDPNVLGILLEVHPNSLGWAQLQEIRSALRVFQDNGKPCKAWGESYGNKEYYLANACDEVYVAPSGVTLVNGLSITQSYYASLFENLQIEANFAHVGDFKSAVEPYERTGPSEAASEASNYLLDSLYAQLKTGMVSEQREQPLSAVDDLMANPPITPNDALERGMVDGLLYRDQILKDGDGIERISTLAYLRKRRETWTAQEQNIAILYASGAIMNGSSGSSSMGSEIIGDRTVVQQLNKIAESNNIKALVLRVNSPGGSGSASDNIWHAINKVKAQGIPVVVSMGNYAASGGYYISMNADYIFAEPGTLTGSIGVFGGKMNIRGLYEKFGVSMHTYKRGAYSTLFSSTDNFSDTEREKYQEFLNSFYTTFVTKAAEGRKMEYDALHAVAQGRVWTGEQALERKLIDELGGLENAIKKASELAKLTDYGLTLFPERKSFIERLLDETDPEAVVSLPDPNLQKQLDNLFLLNQMLSNGPSIAMLPYTINIE
jgi:protease-4